MATSADFSINRIDSFSQILGISHIPEAHPPSPRSHPSHPTCAPRSHQATQFDTLGCKVREQTFILFFIFQHSSTCSELPRVPYDDLELQQRIRGDIHNNLLQREWRRRITARHGDAKHSVHPTQMEIVHIYAGNMPGLRPTLAPFVRNLPTFSIAASRSECAAW